MMNPFHLPAILEEIHWRNSPMDWDIQEDGGLMILAGEHTDWFVDPAGNFSNDNAPCALFTPEHENVILQARVAVDFYRSFDAGGLQLRADEERWAKLCLEYSPQGQAIVVSVVTRGNSDDCNSVLIDGRSVYLRMAVTPRTVSFHYSKDGSFWHFVRHFSLGDLENVQIGFSAQSPTGQKCRAVFSGIKYRAGSLDDLRNGE